MKKIIILIFMTIFMTGCSYVELNELAIASAIGIDYEDNKFKLTAQIMDVKSGDSGVSLENALIYEAQGDTIAKAIRSFSTRYPKNIYFGHLEFIILSSDTAKYKLDEVFDYFMRSPEARTTSFVALTKNETAKEILNPKNEKKGSFPTEEIKSVLLDATKRNGTVYDITFEEFLSNYLKKGYDPVIPLITTSNKGLSSSSTIIEKLVPIKNNVVYEELNNEESIAYNTINNNYYDVVIDSKYDNTNFAAILYNPKSKIELKLNNDKITVNININIESKVSEIDKKVDLNNVTVHRKIKETINSEINKYITDLLNYCKTNNTDILGLGNMIYKNYYKDYKKYQNINLYEKINFKININNKIYRHGNINKGAA